MCLYPVDLYIDLPKPYNKLIPLTDLLEAPVITKRKVTVACGKCLECLQKKSIEWAFRILDEASQYDKNAFITLTYNDDNLYYNECGEVSVSKREMQLFLKRLRKALSPLKIRFFGCGEYGKKFSRPHYHLIIFNWYPDDAWFFKRDGRTDLYRSPLLEKVWTKGFSSVACVNYETALYCAKYMNKWQFDKKRLHKDTCDCMDFYPDKPFIQMSNRPGIGYNCVYDADLKSDRIYRNGKSIKIPRYYLKVMERDGLFLDEFKDRRQAQGSLVASFTDLEAKIKKYNDMFLNNKKT